MASRLHCWLTGHDWGEWDSRVWENLLGNEFRVRWCNQCGAQQSRCIG